MFDWLVLDFSKVWFTELCCFSSNTNSHNFEVLIHNTCHIWSMVFLTDCFWFLKSVMVLKKRYAILNVCKIRVTGCCYTRNFIGMTLEYDCCPIVNGHALLCFVSLTSYWCTWYTCLDRMGCKYFWHVLYPCFDWHI